nr:MAG TPA: hypothetical protein [Caudoviricetes sp.]
MKLGQRRQDEFRPVASAFYIFVCRKLLLLDVLDRTLSLEHVHRQILHMQKMHFHQCHMVDSCTHN